MKCHHRTKKQMVNYSKKCRLQFGNKTTLKNPGASCEVCTRNKCAALGWIEKNTENDTHCPFMPPQTHEVHTTATAANNNKMSSVYRKKLGQKPSIWSRMEGNCLVRLGQPHTEERPVICGDLAPPIDLPDALHGQPEDAPATPPPGGAASPPTLPSAWLVNVPNRKIPESKQYTKTKARVR